MVEIWLPYGDTEVFVNVPTERLLGFFEFQAPQGGVSIQSILSSAMPALSGARTVSLAIDGELIRSEECGRILRALGDSLPSAGLKAFTNADGPLPDLPGLEWRRGGSPDRPFEDLGRTGHGNKVRIDRDFHRSDRRVLLGRLERDPIRGHGWVKGFLECVASPETARANAALALEWDPKTDAERNPSYLDGCECAEIAGIDYALFFVEGRDGGFVDCAQGGFGEALRAGEEKYRQLYSKVVDRRARIAISSAGGAPNDLCFESASRSIFNALGGLEAGGAILALAECRGGIGDVALIDAFARYRNKERLREILEEEPSEAGIHSYLLMRTFEEFRVILVSAIPEALLRPLRIKAFRSANSALESATRALGDDSPVYAIANASKNFLSLAAEGRPGGGQRWNP
ncbi:MAG: hypothetical protein QW645_06465 [Candidatus Bathyarchaeia archaeon]